MICAAGQVTRDRPRRDGLQQLVAPREDLVLTAQILVRWKLWKLREAVGPRWPW